MIGRESVKAMIMRSYSALVAAFEQKYHSDGALPDFVCSLEQAREEASANASTELSVACVPEAAFDPLSFGAYTSSGELVPESALRRWHRSVPIGAKPNKSFSAAQESVDAAVYGGVIFNNHYGHFLCESLSRLWPLFARGYNELFSLPWIFNLSGCHDDPWPPYLVELESFLRSIGINVWIPQDPIVVGDLVVPSPSHRIGEYATPEFRATGVSFGKFLEDGFAGGSGHDYSGQKVYLTRSQLPGTRRRIVGERGLEAELSKEGFLIVAPEVLSLAHQIRIFSESEMISGCIGSTFHTLLLTSSVRGRIVCLSERSVPQTYLNIDRACGFSVEYVPVLRRSRFAGKYVDHCQMDASMAIRTVLASLD
jgi:hypothetical protein